jgi:hypothetical protein
MCYNNSGTTKLVVTSGDFTVGSVGGTSLETAAGTVNVAGANLNTHNVNVKNLSLNGGSLEARSQVNVTEKLDMGGTADGVANGKLTAYYDPASDTATKKQTDGYVTATAVTNNGTITADNYVTITSSVGADKQQLTVIAGKGGVTRAEGDDKTTAITLTGGATSTEGGVLNFIAETGDIKTGALNGTAGTLNLFAEQGKITATAGITGKDDTFRAQEFAVTGATTLDGGTLVATGKVDKDGKQVGANSFAAFTASNGAEVSLAGTSTFSDTVTLNGTGVAESKGNTLLLNKVDFTAKNKSIALTGADNFLQLQNGNASTEVFTVTADAGNNLSFGTMSAQQLAAEKAAHGVAAIDTVVAINSEVDLDTVKIQAGLNAASGKDVALGANTLLVADLTKGGFTMDKATASIDISTGAGIRMTGLNNVQADTT